MITFLIVAGLVSLYGFIGGIGFYVGKRLHHEYNPSQYDEDMGVLWGVIIALLWPLMIPAAFGWAWAAKHFNHVPDGETVENR